MLLTHVPLPYGLLGLQNLPSFRLKLGDSALLADLVVLCFVCLRSHDVRERRQLALYAPLLSHLARVVPVGCAACPLILRRPFRFVMVLLRWREPVLLVTLLSSFSFLGLILFGFAFGNDDGFDQGVLPVEVLGGDALPSVAVEISTHCDLIIFDAPVAAIDLVELLLLVAPRENLEVHNRRGLGEVLLLEVSVQAPYHGLIAHNLIMIKKQLLRQTASREWYMSRVW